MFKLRSDCPQWGTAAVTSYLCPLGFPLTARLPAPHPYTHISREMSGTTHHVCWMDKLYLACPRQFGLNMNSGNVTVSVDCSYTAAVTDHSNFPYWKFREWNGFMLRFARQAFAHQRWYEKTVQNCKFWDKFYVPVQKLLLKQVKFWPIPHGLIGKYLIPNKVCLGIHCLYVPVSKSINCQIENYSFSD